jgi:hypothetical protein
MLSRSLVTPPCEGGNGARDGSRDKRTGQLAGEDDLERHLRAAMLKMAPGEKGTTRSRFFRSAVVKRLAPSSGLTGSRLRSRTHCSKASASANAVSQIKREVGADLWVIGSVAAGPECAPTCVNLQNDPASKRGAVAGTKLCMPQPAVLLASV